MTKSASSKAIGKKWYRFQALPADIFQKVAALPAVLAEEGVRLAYLFGSLAQQAAGNDVDLAMLMAPEHKPYRLREELTDFLDTQRLDIVDLRRAGHVLQFEVISTGRLLYAASDEEQMDFELGVLRTYHDREIPRRRQEVLLRERMGRVSKVQLSPVERLKELDVVVGELRRYKTTTVEELRSTLSRRWLIERGLIAAAGLIFEVADHILCGQFGTYTGTYEESLAALRQQQVISESLYEVIRGLGGFRNVLVHLYQEIEPQQVFESYHKALTVFPAFAEEILAWLETNTSS